MKQQKLHQYRIPIFWLVTSLYWFSLYAYVPNLSPYAEELGASHKLIGLIVGAYGFVQMLIRIPLGIYSDTINRRKLFIVIGIGVSVVSSIIVWVYPNALTLLVSRSLSGVAAAAWVAFTVLFSSYFQEDEAPKAIGYINSSNASGQMVAIFFGGLIAQVFGAKYTFLLASAGGILGLVLSFFLYEKSDVDRVPLKAGDIIEVASDKRLLFFSTLAILSQLVTFATVFGFTPVAAKNLGASEFELGILTTLSILPGVFSSAMSGTFFANKVGKRMTLMTGFLMNSVVCICIPYISHLYLLYITQFFGGFARGMVFSLLMGLSIRNIAAGKRATAMGFFQAIYGLGMFLGPTMLGFLSDTVGFAWGFWIVGLIGTIGTIMSGCFLPKASLTCGQNASVY